jgi:signal transduction histidine kinase
VLVGWWLDNPILKGVFPGLITMKINTAICFLLAGLSYCCAYSHDNTSKFKWIGRAFAITFMVIAGLSLVEYLFQLDFGIDNFFIREVQLSSSHTQPRLMAPTTAVYFLLIGVSILLFRTDNSRLWWYCQILLILVNMGAFFVLFAYLFDTSSLYGLLPDRPGAALHTSITFIILTVGILLGRPTEGIVTVLTNNTLGGGVGRCLLPLTIITPITLGLLRAIGEHFNFYDPFYGMAIAAFINTIVFSVMILWNAIMLRRIDLERKALLNYQTELALQLKYTNNDLQEFAYIISHDLKIPMQGIAAIADQVAAGGIENQKKEDVSALKEQVSRMSGLIDGILRYSRASRAEEAAQSVNFNTLVQEVISVFPNNKNISFAVYPYLPSLVVEPTQIKEIFLNLIDNAIKFMDKPRGEILIDCMENDGGWQFSVSDNGSGIPPDTLEKISALLAGETPNALPESGGVGLSIVKKIVERHGGKVWVESTIGKGTTFYFTLYSNS